MKTKKCPKCRTLNHAGCTSMHCPMRKVEDIKEEEKEETIDVSEYKRRLKEEIESNIVLFTSATHDDCVRNDFARKLINLIDSIDLNKK